MELRMLFWAHHPHLKELFINYNFWSFNEQEWIKQKETVLLSILFKNRCSVSLFKSPGTSPDCQDFSNIMESGVAAASANSLRTLGCILSGPRDLCTFWFLKRSQTWSSHVMMWSRWWTFSHLKQTANLLQLIYNARVVDKQKVKL